MKALDSLSTEKQLELQKSRTTAQKVWMELQNIYNQQHPQVKVEQQSMAGLLGMQMASKLTKLRDQAKEEREKQRRALSAGKEPMTPTLEDVYHTS